MKHPLFLLCLLAVLAAVSSSSAALVIADFSGGNGTTTPDQYQGTAGNGWSGAWNQESGISGTVLNSIPLEGGGNYLSATLSAASANITYISRTWDNTAVPYTAPITFTWQFRLDSSLTVFNTVTDAIGFSDGNGATSTFIVNAFGLGTGMAAAKTWAFYNGSQDNGSFNANNYINTGITLVSGTVYDFAVNLDPSTRTWVGTVSDGVNSFTSNPLGFRTSTFSANGFIQFGMRESSASDNLTFSLDSVAIIPEPGTLGLVFLGIGLACIRIRRHRRV